MTTETELFTEDQCRAVERLRVRMEGFTDLLAKGMINRKSQLLAHIGDLQVSIAKVVASLDTNKCR